MSLNPSGKSRYRSNRCIPVWGQVTPSKILCVSLLTLAITVPVAAVAGTTAVLRFAGMYLQNVNYVPGEVVALSGTSFEAQYVINQKRGYSPLPPPDAVIATGPLKGTPYWQPIPFLGIPGIQGIQGPPGPALASIVNRLFPETGTLLLSPDGQRTLIRQTHSMERLLPRPAREFMLCLYMFLLPNQVGRLVRISR